MLKSVQYVFLVYIYIETGNNAEISGKYDSLPEEEHSAINQREDYWPRGSGM
jgi:hypothetical protein